MEGSVDASHSEVDAAAAPVVSATQVTTRARVPPPHGALHVLQSSASHRYVSQGFPLHCRAVAGLLATSQNCASNGVPEASTQVTLLQHADTQSGEPIVSTSVALDVHMMN